MKTRSLESNQVAIIVVGIDNEDKKLENICYFNRKCFLKR